MPAWAQPMRKGIDIDVLNDEIGWDRNRIPRGDLNQLDDSSLQQTDFRPMTKSVAN